MDTKTIVDEVKPKIVEKIKENLLKETKTGYLDIGLSKFTSRKLLAWIAATIFLIQGYIPPSDWILVTLLWIGVQGVLDLYKIRATIADRSR